MDKRIDTWLRRNIFNQKDSQGPIFKICLRHVIQGNKIGSEISQFEVSTAMQGPDIEALVNEIETHAYDDASGISGGGIQRYVLLPYYKLSPDKPIGRLVFNVSSNEDGESGDTLDSEPATQKGLLSQLMRHNEALSKTLVLGMQSVIQSQQRTINQQSQQLEHVSDKHFEAISLIEDLSTGKHERELETKRLELRQQMQLESFNNIKMLMPVVVNKLTGKKIMKEPVTAQQMLLKQFMDSIKPEQFQTFLGQMNQEQQIAMMELYQSMYDVGENGEAVSPNSKNGENS